MKKIFKIYKADKKNFESLVYKKEIQIWGRGEQKIAMSGGKVFSVSKTYRNGFDNFLKKKVL